MRLRQPIQEAQPEKSEPERPWTPSYAVTQQGSSPKVNEAELPPSTAEAASTEKAEESDRPASRGSWTRSYSVSRQGSTSSLKDAQPAGAEQTEPAPSEPEAVIAAPVPVRPSSRSSWTPSYSISRQGSRSSLKEAASPAAPAVVEVETAPEPEGETSAAAAAVPERPVSRGSWAASYSVSRQGSRSSLKPAADGAPAAEPLNGQKSPIVVDGATLVEEPTSQESAAPAEGTPDRPWTPSYSVSRQGTSPGPVSKDLPSTNAPSADETRSPPERPWTPSYSVSRQGTSPVPSPKPQSAELAEPAQTPPERPWTPSYSVSRQGSTHLVSAAETVEEKTLATPVINVEEAAAAASEEPAKAEEPAVERPWTPSYSVSQQGTSPISSPQVRPAEPKSEVEPVQSDDVKPEAPTEEAAVDVGVFLCLFLWDSLVFG
jgi:hypothetical protein